jgi:hypothetical protein
VAKASYFQTSFLAGEWSKQSQGRADKPEYRAAMNLCHNALPIEEGANTRRPGTRLSGYTRNGAEGVLREFHFSSSHPYTMEFTPGKLRFRNGTELAVEEGGVVTAISTDTPALISTGFGHGYSTGDQVLFLLYDGITTAYGGIADIVDVQFTVTVVSPSSFTITDAVTGIDFDGSMVTLHDTALQVLRIVELTTPYDTPEDLDALVIAQDEEDAIIFSPLTPPHAIKATLDEQGSPTGFATFALRTGGELFFDGPYLDPPIDGSYLIPDQTTNPWTMTLVGSAHAFSALDVDRMIRVFSEPNDWNVGTSYAVGDTVKFGEDYWSALKASTGKQPDLDFETWATDPSAAAWSWGTISSVIDAHTFVVDAAPADPLGVKAGGPLLSTNHIRTWRLGVYSQGTGFPSCGTFHEGRLWMGGPNGNRADSSMSNETFTFSPTLKDGTVADNCGISAVYRATSINRPLWMLPDDQGVVIGTQAGEWLVRASSLNDPITPTSIQAHRATTFGCAPVQPVQAPLSHVFVQRNSRKVVEYVAAYPPRVYTGQSISLQSKHLFDTDIQELAYQAETTPVIWARTKGGKLLGCTYRRDSQFSSQPVTFAGWHQHTLGTGRAVRSICVGPSPTLAPKLPGIQPRAGNTDTLTLVTHDAGDGFYRVELLTALFEEDDRIEDAWFVDGGVSPVGADYKTVGGNKVLRFYALTPGDIVTAWIAGVDMGEFTIGDDGSFDVPVNGTFGGVTNLLTETRLTNMTGEIDTLKYFTAVYDGDFTPEAGSVTYTAEEHTPTKRWTNMFGLNFNPQRTEAVWYTLAPLTGAISGWELWDLGTRTNISRGTLDTSYAAITSGGGHPAAVTRDGFLYSLAALTGSVADNHLVCYAATGAGTQLDKGATPNMVEMSAAMEAADGNTYIGMVSFSFDSDGYLYNHTSGAAPALLDTSVGTGTNFQIKSYILDASGDVWALGGRGDLGNDKLAFWRVVNASGIARTDFFVVTMPASQAGTICEVWGTFVSAGASSHFVVAWPDAGADPLHCTIEYDGTISNTSTTIPIDPYVGPADFRNHDISNPTIFLENTEYSCDDLSVVNTYPYSLWGYLDVGDVQAGAVFDPLNQCMLVGLQNANEKIAWLLRTVTPVKDAVLFAVPVALGDNFETDCQIVRPVAPAETGAQDGPAFGKTRRQHMFTALLNNAQGMFFGTTFGHMRPAVFQDAGEVTLALTTMFSGTYWDQLDDDYSFDSMICWKQTRPYPATVLAIGGFIHTQDR